MAHPVADVPSRLRETESWLRIAARFGYVAKAAVYAAIAILALLAATGRGGRAADQSDVVNLLGNLPFGTAIVGLIAVGLLAFALWRALECFANPEDHGVLKRMGLFASALAYATLGVASIKVVMGGRATSSTQSTAQMVASQPGGALWLVAGGFVILAIGVYSLVKAWTKGFLKELQTETMDEGARRTVTWAGQMGHAARGLVFLVIGGLFVKAGMEAAPKKVGGTEEALQTIAHAPYGPFLLGVVALGLLAYAAFLLFEAKYRRMTPLSS